MIRVFRYFVPLLLSCLTACESFELSNRNESKGTSTANSSASTASNRDRLQSVMKSLISRRERLCPQDRRLHQFLFGAFRAIAQDASLSDAEKQARAQQIFDRFRSVIDRDYARMESCIAANENEWRDLDEEQEAVVDACLPEPSEQRKPFVDARNPNRRPPPPPPPEGAQLTDEEREEIEAKIESQACSAALARYE